MHILSRYRRSPIAQPNFLWLPSALGLALLLCIPLVFASAQKTPPVATKQRAGAPPSWSVCDSSSAGIKVTDPSGLVYTCGESGGSETKSEIKKDKPAETGSATVTLEPGNSDSSAAAPVPVENPVKPPTISWDGKELTIDADNSTLSEILLGIRARTGASIDMPPSTNAEKVFVHLGPAPIREVLSSLLYGTDFDYVIQASDTDERGLRSVTLTEREKGDVVTASDASGQPRQRLMKGYAAPGKRDFQVAAEAADESSASPQTESAAAEASPSASLEQAPAGSEPAATVAGADSQAGASADGMVSGGSQSLAKTALTSPGDSSPSGMSSFSQMQQNLQHLYQQRQQMQALQNQQPPGK